MPDEARGVRERPMRVIMRNSGLFFIKKLRFLRVNNKNSLSK
jgi:hypothetical protein